VTQQSSADNDIAVLLDQIEQLHTRETDALRRMDASLLDDITSAKEVLGERLGSLSGRLEACHREQLARIRQQATMNQLLLVHARDSVRTILSQATGVSFEAMPGARRPATQQGGVRLNVRV